MNYIIDNRCLANIRNYRFIAVVSFALCIVIRSSLFCGKSRES